MFWVSGPLIAGDHHSVALEFRPFKYDPVSGEILMVTELEFELAFVAPDPTAELQPEAEDDPESELVAAAGDADYLIITADEFYEEILPLAHWKHQKGYKTYVVLMSEVGTTDTDGVAFLGG